MSTYLLMGLPFIMLTIVLDLFILKTKVILMKKTWLVMVIIFVLTAAADQALTGLPIVQYNSQHMLGIHLGFVPIEDFSYVIAAVIGLGALHIHGNKHTEL
ncbi:MAG: hypothetical protein NVS1B7_0980 [Candidatus Saccharimonadales bacterium]